MILTNEECAKVISCCKSNLISDWSFNGDKQFPKQWFIKKFDFLGDNKLAEHLGDEFFQTRFAYTLMQTLKLTMSKNKGIIKFQIIQYASICEALLNYSIEKYFKDEFEKRFAATTYCNLGQAISSKTKITYSGFDIFLCSQKIEKAKVTWTRNPDKADFAFAKGLITQSTKEAYCLLYDLRNNAHILKAASLDYYPKLREAKEAYELTFKFIDEIKEYFLNHPFS